MFTRLSYFRLYLALGVVLFHVHRDWFPQAGVLAVLGFFFVSGYLVSKLLCETYSGRPKQFIVNRFLRIFPAYWASLFLGAILIMLIPLELLESNHALRFPVSFDIWVSNIFIVGLNGLNTRIVPPAWSLDIELHWYGAFFLLSFLSVRCRLIFFCLICASFSFFIYPEKIKFYGDVLGSGFAFCLGAIHYYRKPKISPYIVNFSTLLIVPYMFLLPVVLGLEGSRNDESLNWVIMAGFVVLLFVSFSFFLVSPSNQSIYKMKLANFFGALSYPVFLTHWYASGITLYLTGAGKNSGVNLIGTLLFSFLISSLILFLVEYPIAKYRAQIRAVSPRKIE